MTLPAFILGSLLALLYGAAFHMFRGGGLGRLLLYLLLGWIGFWLGQFIATQSGITLFSIGALHVGTATVTSWLILGIGNWLSLVDAQRKGR